MKILFYDLRTSSEMGILRHPYADMEKLGISYKIAEPQTISDGWLFFGVTNLPNPLPPYLTLTDESPEKYIGWGLSEDDVKILNK